MGEPTIVIEKNVPVPMRDGVVLYADVYRPAAAGRYPVILQRTPYDKGLTSIGMLMLDVIRTAGEGYAVVIQDSRGRYTSEGTFYTFRDDVNDGYDTVEWCAVQPWSDGQVGMYGASYVGATQWLAAISTPPHLKAIFPLITASHYHEGWTYQGGAFALGFNESWTMISLASDTYQRLARTMPEAAEDMGKMLAGIDDMCHWFRHLPLKDFPLFGQAAGYFYDWLAHPTTMNTGRPGISKPGIRRSRFRPAMLAAGTIFSWAAQSATTWACASGAAVRTPGRDRSSSSARGITPCR